MDIALEVLIGLGIIVVSSITIIFWMKKSPGEMGEEEQEIGRREIYVVIIWVSNTCLLIFTGFLKFISVMVLLVVIWTILAIAGTKIDKKQT